jgi:YbbR domain-containing protein
MRKKLTNNLGLKLLSLLFAVVIWLIIVYTYDPASTATFVLDVNILNEDAITSLNKVYEVIEGDQVTISAKGNTSLINSLKTTDFKATADISKLSPTYHADIDVVCTKSNNVEISFVGKVRMLEIRLEDVAEKQFKLSVLPEGTPADGYYIGGFTTKPNLIQVTGAKSAINRIAQVVVPVNVDFVSEDFTADVEPKAYDADGAEIKTGKLTFSKETVSVQTTVYGTKEVPVQVELMGEPYAGYRVSTLEYEPKTIVVAGDSRMLSTLESISIPVDVSNKITDVEETIEVSEFLPEGAYLPNAAEAVSIMVGIERLATKVFDVPFDNVQLRNANLEEYVYGLPQEGTFAVKVLGPSDKIDKLELTGLRPYIDLSQYTEEGQYNAEIKFELEADYQMSEKYIMIVEVGLKDKEPEEGELPPEEGGEGQEGSEGSEEGLPENGTGEEANGEIHSET